VIIDAKTKLDAEISRLETLYYVSTILYRKEMQAKYRQSSAKQALPIKFRSTGWEREVAHNAGHFRVIVEKLLPQTLRETILVRMVSALEVFFTDTVREVYSSRRDLLQRQDPIEIPYAKLVSIKSASELITILVGRDCRSLTSGGFNEIEKYFRQKLQIDLKTLVGFSKLREFHDRRHLLVHRLGSVDDEYRHKYKSAKGKLSVEQDYLLESIKTIRDFSSALMKEVMAIAGVTQPSPSAREMTDLLLDLDLLSLEAIPVVDLDFFFLHNEQYFALRDFVWERTPTDTGIILRLRGQTGVIRAYRHKIKRLAEEHKLVIKSTRTRNVKSISEDLIQKVKLELPPLPWTKDIDKAVAKKLGIKLEIAREVIRIVRISGQSLGPEC
jgi:hypothetical protein